MYTFTNIYIQIRQCFFVNHAVFAFAHTDKNTRMFKRNDMGSWNTPLLCRVTCYMERVNTTGIYTYVCMYTYVYIYINIYICINKSIKVHKCAHSNHKSFAKEPYKIDCILQKRFMIFPRSESCFSQCIYPWGITETSTRKHALRLCDVFIVVARHIHMWDVTDSYVGIDPLTNNSCLMTHWHMPHTATSSCILYVCTPRHNMWHGSYICGTWLILYAGRDSLTHDWHSH